MATSPADAFHACTSLIGTSRAWLPQPLAASMGRNASLPHLLQLCQTSPVKGNDFEHLSIQLALKGSLGSFATRANHRGGATGAGRWRGSLCCLRCCPQGRPAVADEPLKAGIVQIGLQK